MIDVIAKDWEQVFRAYRRDGAPLQARDVARPLAAVVEHGCYGEIAVWAVFQMRDGRYAYIDGDSLACNWGERSSCSGAVAASLDILLSRIDEVGREKLGILDETGDAR